LLTETQTRAVPTGPSFSVENEEMAEDGDCRHNHVDSVLLRRSPIDSTRDDDVDFNRRRSLVGMKEGIRFPRAPPRSLCATPSEPRLLRSASA
jgi:hypothetical protein